MKSLSILNSATIQEKIKFFSQGWNKNEIPVRKTMILENQTPQNNRETESEFGSEEAGCLELSWDGWGAREWERNTSVWGDNKLRWKREEERELDQI